MSPRKNPLHLALILAFAVLLQVQGQQSPPAAQQAPPAAVQPRTVQPPQAPVPAPPATATTAVQKPELKFAIIGDTGTGTKPQYEIGQKLATTRTTFPFEFVIMLGDNMYGGESAKDFQNKFEKPYAALLS